MTTPLFVGRDAELSALADGLARAAEGRGGLWLVAGDAGIGKSALCEALAARAEAAGMQVLWGHCWEEGGAPAYWPFTQPLRTLLAQAQGAEAEAGWRAGMAHLGQLLPELYRRFDEEPRAPSLPPGDARFLLMDAVHGVLEASARRRPLLLMLEDLHAADNASLTLLQYVAPLLRAQAIAVVGTYREADAIVHGTSDLLARCARHAERIELGGWGRDEVRDYLARTSGEAIDEALVARVHEVTEGNPLFAVESARLLLSGKWAGTGVALPHNVKLAIEERLTQLSEPARELLRSAAIIGREFTRARLAELCERDEAALCVPLAEAADLSVVDEVAPGRFRFSHILVREVLHQAVPEPERAALHLRLAEHVAAAATTHARWSEVAHHYREAGAAGARGFVDASARAGEQAMRQLAHAEAAAAFDAALKALAELGEGGGPEGVELLIARSRAHNAGGEHEEAAAGCREAAALAKRLGRADLVARAALEHGRMFVVAQVDEALVALLGEALEMLDDEDSALRAQVMARLAAAMQPSLTPEVPIQVAHDAIAMARRLGDPAVLLEAIRAGCSAMMDLADPRERRVLNEEHVALARQLDDRVEQQRGHLRLVFDCYQLGDMPGAVGAVEEAARLADELDLPAFRWRVTGFRACQALQRGDFAGAARLRMEMTSLGERAGDPNVASAAAWLEAEQLRVQGRFDELLALVPRLCALAVGSPMVQSLGAVATASYLIAAGHPERIASVFARRHADNILAVGDTTSYGWLAVVALQTRDTELAQAVRERLEGMGDDVGHGGMLYMTWNEPCAYYVALTHWTLGEHARADACFSAAAERAVGLGDRPRAAWIRHDQARMWREQGDAARADAAAAQARELAEGLEMPGLFASLAASSAAEPAPVAPPSSASEPAPAVVPTLVRDGEQWQLEAGGARLGLRDTKGVRMLAQLMREPGREFHVLDLVEPGGGVDTGDAGEVLDDQALRSYRARMAELRDALEEAEGNNDLSGAERARQELEALTEEVARATGLSGRKRRASAAVERARVNVQRRLKDAITRIRRQDEQLGRQLDRSIRTGTFCSFDPP